MQPSTADLIESARLFYAKELCRINHISSPDILRAFSTVPRERFVGLGPWMIQTSGTEYFTESDDPRNVYQDALIVLDAAIRSRGLYLLVCAFAVGFNLLTFSFWAKSTMAFTIS